MELTAEEKLREAYKDMFTQAKDDRLRDGYISDGSVKEPPITKRQRKSSNWVNFAFVWYLYDYLL